MFASEMKRKSTPGFALLELVLVVAIIALIVGVAVFALNGSKKSNKNSDAEKSKTPALQNDTLILKNLGVASLDSVAVDPAATRDFTASGHKGLYVFGDILPGTPVRQNPNFEFASMKEGTELISALDGIVAFIRQQPETNDYEVFIAPSEQSQWVVGYDHVVNLVG